VSAVYDYIKANGSENWPQSPVHINAWGKIGPMQFVEDECARLEAAHLIRKVEARVHSEHYTERLYVAMELYHTTVHQHINGEDFTCAFYCLAASDYDAKGQALEHCTNELGEPDLQMPYVTTLSEFAADVDKDPRRNFGSWVATTEATEVLTEWRQGHCTQTMDMFAEAGG
jgi:hypothetical protein